MKIAILTDTNSGISKEEAEEKGIYVIPMPVLIDGEVFYDKWERCFYISTFSG